MAKQDGSRHHGGNGHSHRNQSSGGDSDGVGTVKWFNPEKKYGFIAPQGGGKDIFVHISAVERSGLNTLTEGQKVHYAVRTHRGKTCAEDISVRG